MLRQLWQEWKILARHIGNFQARVLITLVYFTLIMPFGLGASLFADPLRMKHPEALSHWLARETRDLSLERAKTQG